LIYDNLSKGWEYTLDGKLAKATELKGCKNFQTKEMGLIPIQVDTMGPWVFINLSKSVDTGTLLGDQPDISVMKDLLDKSGYTHLKHISSRTYKIKCNWKVFIDNYLDGGYHVPYAHKKLAGLLDMKQYVRKEYENLFLQSCSANQSLNSDQSTSSDVNNARIVHDGSNNEALYIYQYPNLCINRYGKWMDTNIVWPIGPHECAVQFDWYVDPSIANDESLVEKCIEDSDRVQQEDIWLCERVQRGLTSSAYDTGRYSPVMETGEFMFHKKLYYDYIKSGMYEI
jgi:choline monooxygenase